MKCGMTYEEYAYFVNHLLLASWADWTDPQQHSTVDALTIL